MYDFDSLYERRHTNSLKWDVAVNELPMWVADMDFQTAPCVVAAINKRTATGIFGYEIIPDEWYEAIQDWWKRRHQYTIRKEWLMFCTGVMPAISSIVRKITTPGENIVVQTPVYNIFFNSITNNGRNILENRLIYKDGIYSIDFEDLEKKLSDSQTTMMIISNPQNPVGKIWERETLKRIGELCSKYHVVVVADEIHCDITDPGCEYTPFGSVSSECEDNCIMCISPTKSFNIAGVQTSAIVVPSEHIRTRVNRAINTDEIAEPNSIAIIAAIAAYTKGEAWLDELREYVYANKKYVLKYISENIPQITVVDSDATYLLWLDCSLVTATAGGRSEGGSRLSELIRKNTGLYLSDGLSYGENGRDFLRMNIACPQSRLIDGLQRLKAGIDKITRVQ